MLPTPMGALTSLVVALVVGASGALLVAKMREGGVRVAYTRKTFHFVIFTAAAGVHTMWDLGGTMVFGGVIAAMVLGAVWLGEGQPFYEALARESDRPHRSMFILIPLATTALGGLIAALLAGPFASVGYLAAGWGDAVGEPVGARWGRHPYKVPSLAGVPATRTLEGSAAVFIVSCAASVTALSALGVGQQAWSVGLVCGAVSALVEAGSNHGLDNLTVQVAASGAAVWLIG